jgi:hypothetical protein
VPVEIVQIACHIFGRRGWTSWATSSLNNPVPARLEFLQSCAVALETDVVDLDL